MKAQEFDQKFDDGEDITEMLDLSQAKRPLSAQKEKIVSIKLPVQIIERINQESSRSGVRPGKIIQSWLAEDLAINNPRKPSQSPRRTNRRSGQTIVGRLDIKLSVQIIERINQEASRLGVRPGKIIQNYLTKHLTLNKPRERSRNPR